MLLVSSEVSAKSPGRAPGTVTSTFAAAAAGFLRRGHAPQGVTNGARIPYRLR
jgi:hypothetical protein